MHRPAIVVVMILQLAACGGGGSGGSGPSVSTPSEPPVARSAGGIWFGFDSTGENVSLYISETGKLRAVMRPTGELIASFGGGTVSVTSDDEVSGTFELRGSISTPSFQQGEDLGCSMSGDLLERQSLSVDIVCSDSGGVVYDERVRLVYDGRSYERPSSLDAIAGTYTLDFRRDSNSLTVVADGTLFGMYSNGPRCTVDGNARIIDEAYTLIGVTWTFSSCTDLLGIYDGVEMSGFALADPAPTGPPGRYYFLLTGRTDRGVDAISVLYEPI